MKKLIIFSILQAISIVLFINARADAIAFRGSQAVGGEVLILLLPFIIVMGYRVAKDYMNEIRD